MRTVRIEKLSRLFLFFCFFAVMVGTDVMYPAATKYQYFVLEWGVS